MNKSQQTLAEALRRVHSSATGEIVRGPEIAKQDRLLLSKRGFLVEIIKGWYALTTPQAEKGDTTFWHAHFWGFVSAYLKHRLGIRYSLSAEHSLDLWSGSTRTPSQLVIIAGKGGTSTVRLPNDTSLLIYLDRKNLPSTTELRQGVQVMSLALALSRVRPTFFRHSATTAEIVLRLVRPEDISRVLLGEEGSSAAAGRLIGAFRHCGLHTQADRLADDLSAAGFEFSENNPFESQPQLPIGLNFASAYVGRLKTLWAQMRPVVQDIFPAASGALDKEMSIQDIADIYTHDAYHSLSIEGYQVTEELINRIANGEWNPESNVGDLAQVNAMAAKGYHEAFKAVLNSVGHIFDGQPASDVTRRDLANWYRSLFSPSVQAGILPPHALAGYRNRPVFIRGSGHAPPPCEAVPELIDTFFDLLATEPSAGVQAVLGHFFFVFIHPYSDGNGRIGRFLLNTFLVSGRYPWAIIRMEHRREYMDALEDASVRHDISTFTRFIAAEMENSAEFRKR